MAGNWRAAIAFTFIGGGALLLVYLLLSDGSSGPDASSTSVTLSTTTTTVPTTTATTGPTTTTTVDPEVRKAEVQRILEDLEIAWYDAVYRKDETVLPDILATSDGVGNARSAMEAAEFAAAPSRENVRVSVLEVLLDRPDCLVAHAELDVTLVLPESDPLEFVQIMWPRTEGGSDFRLAGLWSSPADLWLDDCDLMRRDDVP